MNKTLFAAVFFLVFKAYASECDFKNFDTTQFMGVFDQVKYICKSNFARGSSCYSTTDRYKKVSQIFIGPYPLGTEVGLRVEMLDSSDRPVVDHTFSTVLLDRETRLTCTESESNGVKFAQIKEEKNFGEVVVSSQITRKGKTIEYEIKSSLRSESSSYRFIVSNP